MGIGVYEAYEFAKALGGGIEVTSRVGEGTTFLVSLPLADKKVDRGIPESGSFGQIS
jgi:signal transduction histidine kinase